MTSRGESTQMIHTATAAGKGVKTATTRDSRHAGHILRMTERRLFFVLFSASAAVTQDRRYLREKHILYKAVRMALRQTIASYGRKTSRMAV